MMLRFDPNLRWLFLEVPMLDRYRAAAAAGFNGVEVAFPYDFDIGEIKNRLDENQLNLVQILTPFDWTSGERGIACLPDRKSDFRRSIDKAIEYATHLGRPLIHVMAGNVPEAGMYDRCLACFIENIALAADIAEKEGVCIVVEPCSRAVLPRYLLHDIETVSTIIRRVKSSNIKICFDTYHIASEGGDLEGVLSEHFDLIGHIQIADVPGRGEPGSGQLDFARFFELLKRFNWGGWVGCEYTPSSRTTNSLDWLERAA